MKQERIILDREYVFDDSKVIISKTDLKGRITFVSPDFAEISGYSEKELLGKPHNTVRHPDMPKLVFKELWDTIQRGEPWQGIIKNLRKNGEYYWVAATVIPIRKNGQIIEYMSIRKRPRKKDIEKAQKLYKKLLDGLQPSRAHEFVQKISSSKKFFILGLVFYPLLLINFFEIWLQNFSRDVLICINSITIGVSLLYSFFTWKLFNELLVSSKKIQEQLTSFSLGNFEFTISEDFEFESIEMKKIYNSLQIAMQGTWGILLQLKSKSKEVWDFSETVLAQSKRISHLSQEFSASTQEKLASMEQISASINEIHSSTVNFSKEINEIHTYNNNLFTKLTEIVHNLNALQTAHLEIQKQLGKHESETEKALQSMKTILDFSRKIEKIVIIIKDIANKTNLLSLNASIEAERAGEHGKGFAVVAQEISKLADQTTQSVKEIKELIAGTSNIVSTGEKQISMIFFEMQEIIQRSEKSILVNKKISEELRGFLNSGKELQKKYDEIANYTKVIQYALQEEKEGIASMAASTEKLSNETETLVHTMEELNQLAQALKDNSEYVKSLIDHFNLKNI